MAAYVSPRGFRGDGRKCNEFRLVKGVVCMLPSAEGSVRLSLGESQVLVSVYGPGEMTIELEEEESWIVGDGPSVLCRLPDQPCNFCVIFGGLECENAERGTTMRSSDQYAEYASLIQRCFEWVIFVRLFHNSEVGIFI